jgi:hypothetical protein
MACAKFLTSFIQIISIVIITKPIKLVSDFQKKIIKDLCTEINGVDLERYPFFDGKQSSLVLTPLRF